MKCHVLSHDELDQRLCNIYLWILPAGRGRLCHSSDQHSVRLWLWVPGELWEAGHHSAYWPVGTSDTVMPLTKHL